MIVRYPLSCNGCGAVTVLRIAVGHRDRDPFRFECEQCHQEISGTFVTDQKAVAVKGLEDVAGATLAESEEGAQYYHLYSSDFATESSQEQALGLSPFMTAYITLGSKFDERMGRVTTFFGLLDNDGAELKRIARNFFAENWPQYKRAVGKYLDWPLEEPLDQQRALFQLFELMLGSIFTSEGHVALIVEMNDQLVTLLRSRKQQFLAFIDEALSRGYLKESRQVLLEQLLRFCDEAEDFRTVLPFWDPADPNASFPTGLAVRAPRAFHELKSLYVDLYEAIARALTLVTALGNLLHRGNHNHYLPHPNLGGKFAPQSMADFHRRSNAPKIEYVAELPWLAPWIAAGLDPKLRNAIGHNSSRYNSKNGTIEYQLDAAGTVRSMSYGEFLFGILRLARSALQLAHLTKQLFVFDRFRDMDLTDAPEKPAT